VAWWRNGQGVELMTRKVAGSTPGLVLSGSLTTLGKLFTHIYAFVTTEYNSVPDKGLRRTGNVSQTSVVCQPAGSRPKSAGRSALKNVLRFCDVISSYV